MVVVWKTCTGNVPAHSHCVTKRYVSEELRASFSFRQKMTLQQQEKMLKEAEFLQHPDYNMQVSSFFSVSPLVHPAPFRTKRECLAFLLHCIPYTHWCILFLRSSIRAAHTHGVLDPSTSGTQQNWRKNSGTFQLFPTCSQLHVRHQQVMRH